MLDWRVDIDMTKEEREQMIEILAMRTGYNRSYYEKMDKEQLNREYLRVMSEHDD
jgi:RNA binding exosome subunit